MKMQCALIATAVLALCACSAPDEAAPSAPSVRPPITGTAYVDVTALAQRHPFADALAQMDREIAALRTAGGGSALEQSTATIAHGIAAVRNDAARAQVDAGFVQARAMPDLTSVPASAQRAGASESGAYRNALVAQEQFALTTLANSLSERTQRAYSARAQELRERESNLALTLAERDAGSALNLRIKLQAIKLAPNLRARLQRRLDALMDSQSNAVDAQRRSDAVTLASYLTELRASAKSEFARAALRLRSQTEANWTLRERVAQAQARGSQALSAANATSFQMPAPVQPQFSAAAGDIASQFRSVSAADAAARAGAAQEIAALEQARTALRAQVLALIRHDATSIAAQRGLRLVDRPRAGSTDLTSAVSAKITAEFGE